MAIRIYLFALLVEMSAACTDAGAALIITGQSDVSRSSGVDSRTQRIAIQGDRERIESGDRVMLIDAARGQLIVLNRATRTYTVAEMASDRPDSAPVRKAAFAPTGEVRTIAHFRCKVFAAYLDGPGGEETVTACLTTSAPGWEQYGEFNRRLAHTLARTSRHPRPGTAGSLPPGFPLSVETTTTRKFHPSATLSPEQAARIEERVAKMPPLVSRDTVTEITLAPLPPGAFSVPAGWVQLRIAGPVEH